MYGIAHRDIPLSQQAIQAAHACLEFALQNGRPSDNHPSLIFLTVRDKPALEKLRSALVQGGIATSAFSEPYKDWGLTAIACLLSEDQRALLKGLQLWKLPTQGELA